MQPAVQAYLSADAIPIPALSPVAHWHTIDRAALVSTPASRNARPPSFSCVRVGGTRSDDSVNISWGAGVVEGSQRSLLLLLGGVDGMDTTETDAVELPSLGALDRSLHSIRASAAVSRITVFEEAAMDGSAHAVTVPLGGGICQLPAWLRQRARSLSIQLIDSTVRVIFERRTTDGNGGATPAPTYHFAAADVDAPNLFGWMMATTPMMQARIDPFHHAQPRALCVGARVSGVALFEQRSFDGEAMVFWRGVRVDATAAAVTAAAAAAAAAAAITTSPEGVRVPHEPLGGEVCFALPAMPHSLQSLRVVRDVDALLALSNGGMLVVRESLPRVSQAVVAALGGAHAVYPAVTHGSREEQQAAGPISTVSATEKADVVSVCLGRSLRALQVHAAARWEGRHRTHMASSRSNGCVLNAIARPDATSVGGTAARTASWHRLSEIGSLRLLRRADTVELSGPALRPGSPPDAVDGVAEGGATERAASSSGPTATDLRWRSLVLSATVHRLPSLAFNVTRVALGIHVRAVQLYAAARFEGAVLDLRSSTGARRPHGADDAVIDLLPAWHDAVRSVTIMHESDGASGVLLDSDPTTPAQPVPARAFAEFHMAVHGEVLPFRSPSALALEGFPSRLARGEHGRFHAYNPSLLAEPDGSVTVVARWSNYNFCSPKRNFEANLAEARGAVMSFVVRGTLNTTTWQLTPAASGGGREGLAVWSEVSEAFPVDDTESISGAEDPRLIRLGRRTLLLLAAWETHSTVQWQHMARVDGGGAPRAPLRKVRMAVDERYRPALRPWLSQFALPPQGRVREKNWAPFAWRGALYAEYSLEPRLVLAINEESGEGTPLLPMTSAPAVRAWVRKLGPVSGGTPAVELPDCDCFLALAHVKLFKKKGSRTATSTMMYKHFWYAFEARPPFSVLGTSLPFTLPSQLPTTPSIQFATGLLFRPATRELVVSYGELDCHATLARFPLTATLESIFGRRKADTPTPLLTPLVVLSRSRDEGGAAINATLQAPAISGRRRGVTRVSGSKGGGVRGVPGDSEALQGSDVGVLASMLSVLAHSNIDDEEGRGGSQSGKSPPRRPGGGRTRTTAAAPAPRATLLMSGRCDLSMAEQEALRQLNVRRICLACAWSSVHERQAGEATARWADRVYDELSGFDSHHPTAARAVAVADLSAMLRTSSALLPPLRDRACTVLCAGGEPLVLCACEAATDGDRSGSVHAHAISPISAAIHHVVHGHYGLLMLTGQQSTIDVNEGAGEASRGASAGVARQEMAREASSTVDRDATPLALMLACIARAHSPATVLTATLPSMEVSGSSVADSRSSAGGVGVDALPLEASTLALLRLADLVVVDGAAQARSLAEKAITHSWWPSSDAVNVQNPSLLQLARTLRDTSLARVAMGDSAAGRARHWDSEPVCADFVLDAARRTSH